MDPESVPVEVLPEGLDVISVLSTVIGDPWVVTAIVGLVSLMITLQLIGTAVDIVWRRFGMDDERLTIFGYMDDPKEQRRIARKHGRADRRGGGFHAFMRDQDIRPGKRRRSRKSRRRGNYHHVI